MLYFNNHLIKLQIYNTNTISQNPSFRVIAIKTLFPIADACNKKITFSRVIAIAIKITQWWVAWWVSREG